MVQFGCFTLITKFHLNSLLCSSIIIAYSLLFSIVGLYFLRSFCIAVIIILDSFTSIATISLLVQKATLVFFFYGKGLFIKRWTNDPSTYREPLPMNNGSPISTLHQKE